MPITNDQVERGAQALLHNTIGIVLELRYAEARALAEAVLLAQEDAE